MVHVVPLLCAAVLAANTLAVSGALAAPLYRYVDLGPDTRAWDINPQGAIAGATGSTAAILRDGTWHLRPAADEVLAIDRQGEAIGQDRTDQGTYDQVYWPRGGHAVPVTMPFENLQVVTRDVANGRVAGYSWETARDAHCFIWSADTATAVDIGTGRDGFCYAHGVNDAGQVAGEIEPATGPRTGFIWQDGQFQYLGLLPGGTWSAANAINRHGHVAMTATRTRHDGILVWRPALWNGQRIVDLGTIERSRQCEATALNDHDEVIGRCNALHNLGWRPFLHTGGQMYLLAPLIENLEGRPLGEPQAINEDGTIVGLAWQGGSLHGYRLERVGEGRGVK